MDDALIAEAKARLYSGVISDVLDGLGNMHHALRRACGRSTTRLCCSAARARRSTCRSITSSRAAIRTSWRSR